MDLEGRLRMGLWFGFSFRMGQGFGLRIDLEFRLRMGFCFGFSFRMGQSTSLG